MKNIIIFLFMIVSINAMAQLDVVLYKGEKVEVINKSDTTKSAICKERGHIIDLLKMEITITKHLPIQYIDYPDSTIMIDLRKTSITKQYCVRCSQWIEEKDEPKGIVIWRKKEIINQK